MLIESIKTHARFEAINRGREKAAASARGAQAKYRRIASLFIVSTTLAAVVGGLLLYGLDSENAQGPMIKNLVAKDGVQQVLIVLQALCLASAALFGYLQHHLRYDQAWVINRIDAENGRLNRAKVALEIGHDLGHEAFKSAGGYFFDELVDKQLQYLSKASNENERSSKRLVIFGALFVGISALISTLAGLAISIITLLGALVGVISPAFIAAMQSWEGVMSNRERAMLHAATWKKLNQLSGSRGELTAAVDQHDLEGALLWADKVIEVLKEDHKGFETLTKAHPIVGQDAAS